MVHLKVGEAAAGEVLEQVGAAEGEEDTDVGWFERGGLIFGVNVNEGGWTNKKKRLTHSLLRARWICQGDSRTGDRSQVH